MVAGSLRSAGQLAVGTTGDVVRATHSALALLPLLLQSSRLVRNFGAHLTTIMTTVGRRVGNDCQAANPLHPLFGPSRLGLLAASLLFLLAGGILFSVPMTLPVNAQTDLTAPSGLTAQRDGCGVSLSWDAPQQDASSVTGYRVLRAKGSAALETLVSDTGSTDTE